jgi:hypothetical protein
MYERKQYLFYYLVRNGKKEGSKLEIGGGRLKILNHIGRYKHRNGHIETTDRMLNLCAYAVQNITLHLKQRQLILILFAHLL